LPWRDTCRSNRARRSRRRCRLRSARRLKAWLSRDTVPPPVRECRTRLPKDQTFTFYPKPQFAADTPKIQLTEDCAIWFAPRGSQKEPAISVLYPDMDKIASFGAHYFNGPPGYLFKPVMSATERHLPRPPLAATTGR
jgi:hypothetical protein